MSSPREWIEPLRLADVEEDRRLRVGHLRVDELLHVREGEIHHSRDLHPLGHPRQSPSVLPLASPHDASFFASLVFSSSAITRSTYSRRSSLIELFPSRLAARMSALRFWRLTPYTIMRLVCLALLT